MVFPGYGSERLQRCCRECRWSVARPQFTHPFLPWQLPWWVIYSCSDKTVGGWNDFGILTLIKVLCLEAWHTFIVCRSSLLALLSNLYVSFEKTRFESLVEDTKTLLCILIGDMLYRNQIKKWGTSSYALFTSLWSTYFCVVFQL